MALGFKKFEYESVIKENLTFEHIINGLKEYVKCIQSNPDGIVEENLSKRIPVEIMNSLIEGGFEDIGEEEIRKNRGNIRLTGPKYICGNNKVTLNSFITVFGAQTFTKILPTCSDLCKYVKECTGSENTNDFENKYTDNSSSKKKESLSNLLGAYNELQEKFGEETNITSLEQLLKVKDFKYLCEYYIKVLQLSSELNENCGTGLQKLSIDISNFFKSDRQIRGEALLTDLRDKINGYSADGNHVEPVNLSVEDKELPEIVCNMLYLDDLVDQDQIPKGQLSKVFSFVKSIPNKITGIPEDVNKLLKEITDGMEVQLKQDIQKDNLTANENKDVKDADIAEKKLERKYRSKLRAQPKNADAKGYIQNIKTSLSKIEETNKKLKKRNKN